ncbi:MAG: hypothetical protein MUF84_15445 [Anaerolineae bacterium]|jgi:hypothetical protein|nr:hypothetical protein [Anaerolineae bacterium]
MQQPHLTFFCELEPDALTALFSDASVVETLLELQAAVSLGLIDLCPERAAVVQALNRVGIPVVAWLLLPKAEGYWANADNAPQMVTRYAEFRVWTARYALRWAGVAIDVEPPYAEVRAAMQGHVAGLLPRWGRRALDGERHDRATSIYATLIDQMRLDGHTVESYQLPFIVDERRAGARLLQRLLGLVDLRVDREVLMLYTSVMPSVGPGLLWSYARDAQGIGVGSTGGGVDDFAPLDWEALARDLRLACRWSAALYVFSLEGCVRQGFLGRLVNFDWETPEPVPELAARRVLWARRVWRAVLWGGAHPAVPLAGLLGVVWICRWLTRPLRRRTRR